jgi:hypothetical protein
MVYPKSLSYFVNKVSNFSTNVVKLLPYRVDSVSAGQIITVDLPANSLIDLRTLAFHFTMTTTASGGTNNFATAPQSIESLIDKLTVEINGQSIGSCANLNYVYNALLPVVGGTDMKNKRAVYANAGDVANPTANLTNEPFCIQNWLGFIGSVKPDVIDTAMLGNVRLSISLANGNCLVKANTTGPTTASYTLNDLHFTVNTLSIDDGVFYPLHAQFLSAGNQYEMPFDSYMTSLFSASTMNQSSRFSISTQSLDMLIGTFPTAYNTLSAVNAVSGRGAQFDTTGTGLDTWKFTINNVAYPQFTAGKHHSYPLLLNALNAAQDVTNGISPNITKASWLSSFCIFAQSFNLGCDADSRTTSGLNTLGSSCQLSFESTGSTTVNYVLMIAKSTSILRVGGGRSIEVVL